MKILTVSIAAYNVAPYLRQALDSCIIPEIMDELEVLVINDGSTDATPEIAKEYVEKFPQTFCLINKENGGYGSTVNLSIEKAKGKYFKLLDGDDWFDKIGLKSMVMRMREIDVDVIVTAKYNGVNAACMKLLPLNIKKNEIELLVSDMKTTELYSMHKIAYKTEILRESRLSLPEHRLYTDAIYRSLPLIYAKTVFFLNEGVYCYRIARKGQSMSRETLRKHYRDMIENTIDLVKRYDECKKEKEISYWATVSVANTFNEAIRSSYQDKLTNANRKKMMKFDLYVKKLSPDIYAAADKVNMGIGLYIMRRTRFFPYFFVALAGKR